MKHALLAVTAILLLCGNAVAGISLPDAVVFGPVAISGTDIVAADNVTIVARVAGVPEPVGLYKMGQNPLAGNQFLLHVRVESLADGSAQSSNAAKVGDTVLLFVRDERTPPNVTETQQAQFVIQEPGAILNVGVGVTTGACCLGTTCSDTLPTACTGGFVCNVADYLPSSFDGCYGDVDGNGFVNPGDRGFIAANFGQVSPALMCRFDMDGNGFINPGDRGFVAANIGLCSPLPDWQNGSGLNHSVPDPRFPHATFLGPGTSCAASPCAQ